MSKQKVNSFLSNDLLLRVRVLRNMKTYLSLFLGIAWTILSLQAQDSLSNTIELPLDSFQNLTSSKKKLTPKQIGLYSLVLPGAGHIINKKYLKLPIAYIGVGAAIYGIQFNTSRYNLLEDAYCARLIKEGSRSVNLACPPLSQASQNKPEQYEILVESYSASSIRSLRDSYDKNRQLSWVGLFATHLVLNGVWSFVDAHLNDFDISEDLSLRLIPSIETSPTPVVGLGLSFQIR